MNQVIAGGGGQALVATGTQYNALMGVTSYSTDTGVARQLIPTGGTISKLRVKLSAAVAAGATWTFTLNVNGSASALTCTINAGETTGSDVSNSVAVSAGDRVFIETTFTGSPGTPVAFWTTLWTPTTAGESICLFKLRTQFNATRYGGIQGPNGADLDTENYVQVPCPSSGGFKKLYCRYYQSSMTASKGYDVTLRVDGSDSALAVSLLGPDATGNDTADTISCTAGQLLSISAVPSNSPNYTVDIACGMVWADDTDGNALVTGFYPLGLAASNFLTLHETGNASSPEDDMQSLVQAYYIKHLYARLTSAPPAGSPCTFMLRLDKADSVLTVTISNPATTGNYLTQNATLTDGMLAGMQIASPPSGSRGSWGMVLSNVGETYDLTCSDGLVVGETLDTNFEFVFSGPPPTGPPPPGAQGISFGDTVTISLAKIVIVPPMLTWCDNATLKMNCRNPILLTYCDNPTLKLNDSAAVLQLHSQSATLKTKSRSTVL